MKRKYKVVDAFSEEPLKGNPVAVILESDGLDDTSMQAIANWTNLSETTFVLPPTVLGADYRLRIFTPRSELPFAGHPTLGSAHAVIEAGIAAPKGGKLVQECGVGLVEVAVTMHGAARTLTLSLPPATVTSLSSAGVLELESVIGRQIVREAAPAIVNVGAVWVVAQLPSVQALLDLRPDLPGRLRLNVALASQASRCSPAMKMTLPASKSGLLRPHVAWTRIPSAAAAMAASPYFAPSVACCRRVGRSIQPDKGSASPALERLLYQSIRAAKPMLGAPV